MGKKKLRVRKILFLKQFWVKKDFRSKMSKMWVHKIFDQTKNFGPEKFWSNGNILFDPNKFGPPKLLGPKGLVKIGSVTALLPWTKFLRSNVACANVPPTS